MNQQVVINVENLDKVFKDFWGRNKVQALKDVTLQINLGQVFALLGPNGSGKTTFIKILLGLLAPTKGSVSIFGDSIFKTSNKARIGLLPEASYFYQNMNGYETLDFYAKLLSLPKAQRLDRIEYLLDLTEMTTQAHRRLGDYSQGMQRRIGIAQALLADPELLILDEPTNGLDPIAIEQVHNLISKLKNEGKTILICTHLLSETENVCDDLALLYEGQLLSTGALQDLYSEYQCQNMKDLFYRIIESKQTINTKIKDAKVSDDDDNPQEPDVPNEDYLKNITHS